jgi:beta-lactamase class A
MLAQVRSRLCNVSMRGRREPTTGAGSAARIGEGETMTASRRDFLKTGAAAATLTLPAMPASARDINAVSSDTIDALFAALPGDVGYKIMVPMGKKMFVARRNADRMLFAASAIKTFVLCEALRQVDAPDVVTVLEDRKLALDASVWSPGSPIFDPPDLTGTVSERTAMEAMITRSDNTATDMLFAVAGADNVRAFIASAGLANTLVPDSTRVFAGYLFGAPNYKTITWDELLKAAQGGVVNPFLNTVETLASSANDFVSYYSRALQGAFFTHPETLREYRRVLTLCDYISLIPLPSGVSAYAKSGNADAPGFHVRTIAGGLNFADQWVYFAFLHNWYAEAATDPATVAQLFAAINASLSLVKASLSKG